MSNDPQADLISAILAMDSYNRGYGASIKDLKVSTANTSVDIGHWIIDYRDSAALFGQGAQQVGFYALAYKNAATHETLISYRGSDTGFSGGALLNKLFGGSTDNDVLNGYGVAVGSPDGPQALLALQFYRAIAGANAGKGQTLLTGHS